MITVLSNQSLSDIAIQEDGTVLAVFEWALTNDISVTDELVPGQKLIIPESVNRDREIANYFKSRKQNIASSYPAQLSDIPTGIDYMMIETDFIVAAD